MTAMNQIKELVDDSLLILCLINFFIKRVIDRQQPFPIWLWRCLRDIFRTKIYYFMRNFVNLHSIKIARRKIGDGKVLLMTVS